MKALVLAAGRGERLGAAAGGLPKPLVDAGGTTPLDHALRWIAEYPLERIWINVHAQGAMVRSHVGTAVAGVPVSYSDEPELLGTAGAWKRLEAEWTEASFVVYGDNLMRFDLAALLATHRRSGAVLTMALIDPARHVHTGGHGGRARLNVLRVEQFTEGGRDGMINTGAYCVEPGLARRLDHGFADFGHDVLPLLAGSGELAGHVVEEGAYCLGVDTPERLDRARAFLRARTATSVEPGTVR